MVRPVRIAEALATDRNALVALCEHRRSTALAALPFIAAEIADAASFDMCFDFIERRGGTVIDLPWQVRPDGKLAREIGERALARVLRHVGSGPHQIPSQSSVVSALRCLVVDDLARQGLKTADIARRLGVSRKTVERLKLAMRHGTRRSQRSPSSNFASEARS